MSISRSRAMVRLPSSGVPSSSSILSLLLAFLLLALTTTTFLPSTTTPTITSVSAASINPIFKIGAALPLSGAYSGSGYRAWLLLNQSLIDLRSNLPSSILPNTTLQLVVTDTAGTIRGSVRAALKLEALGCGVIIGGVHGIQNQNLTLFPADVIANIQANRVPNAVTSSSLQAAIEGVAINGRGIVDGMSMTMRALKSKLPVLISSSSGCNANSVANTIDNFIPLCLSNPSLSDAVQGIFSTFGWTRFSLITQTGMSGSYNSRYSGATGSTSNSSFSSTSGLGSEGGGYSEFNQYASLTSDLVNEVYGSTTSRPKILQANGSWSYPLLREVKTYRLPNIAMDLPGAIARTIQAIKASRIYIIVVLLNGDALQQFLQAAYLAKGMLGKDSPYVWVGLSTWARRGGNIGTAAGSGTYITRGVGPGLCSTQTAADIQTFQNQVFQADLAAGRISTTGNIGITSTVATIPTSINNPVVGFATSNPLIGAFCIVPSTPSTSLKWINLRYRLLEGGLPNTTLLDNQDGTTYDSVLIIAYALHRAQLVANKTGVDVTSADMIREMKQNTNFDGLSGHWSFSQSTGQRQGLFDLINFEQLKSGSMYHFPRRATYDPSTGQMSVTSNPIIFASGTSTIPSDYVLEYVEGESLDWTIDTSIVFLQLALAFIAAANVVMYISRVRKYDASVEEQRSRYYAPLVKAALSYVSVIMLGTILLGLSYLKIISMDQTIINSLNQTTIQSFMVQFNVAWLFLAWIVGFGFMFLGLAIASSQNSSTVSYYKSAKINRYEIAGKTGVSGGGGGSGLYFLQSESGGSTGSGSGSGMGGNGSRSSTGESHVGEESGGHSTAGDNQVHAIGKGHHALRAHTTGHKRSLSMHRSPTSSASAAASLLVESVPFYSRFLEECYITLLLCFTSWRMVIGGFFITVAHLLVMNILIGTRTLPTYIIETQNLSIEGSYDVVLLIAHSISLTIIFRETRFWKQCFGTLWLCLVNVCSFFVIINGCLHRYSTTNDGVNIKHSGQSYWSRSDITICLFILIAVTILSNLGLIIDILQLSRGTLDQVLLNAKRNLSDLEQRLIDKKQVTKSARGVQEYMRKCMELINLIRPLHRNHSLAFALVDVSEGLVGGKQKKSVIPPCFDANDYAARGTTNGTAATGVSAGMKDNSNTTVIGGTTSAGMTNGGGGGANVSKHAPHSSFSIPSSAGAAGMQQQAGTARQPSVTGPSGAEAAQQAIHGATTTPVGSLGIVSTQQQQQQPLGQSSLDHLDFTFLARSKNELNGLKLLTELSERLFLASGPVHHRAVADIRLQHILSHPVTIELFKDTLSKPSAQHALMMYLDIQRWKGLETNEGRRTVAEGMYQTFLNPNSSNLSNAINNAITGSPMNNQTTGSPSLHNALLSTNNNGNSGNNSNNGNSNNSSICAVNPHLLTSISSVSREAIYRALYTQNGSLISSSTTLVRTLFDTIEVDVLAILQKEMSSFQGTTAFKIVALILGHTAYQPDTRIAPVVRGRVVQAAQAAAQLASGGGGGGGAGAGQHTPQPSSGAGGTHHVITQTMHTHATALTTAASPAFVPGKMGHRSAPGGGGHAANVDLTKDSEHVNETSGLTQNNHVNIGIATISGSPMNDHTGMLAKHQANHLAMYSAQLSEDDSVTSSADNSPFFPQRKLSNNHRFGQPAVVNVERPSNLIVIDPPQPRSSSIPILDAAQQVSSTPIATPSGAE